MKRKTVSLVSLGCFRNLCDSEVILHRMVMSGYKLIDGASKVDTLIINTCGFIKDAKQESIEAIRDAVESKKRGRIKNLIVVGCLVERYKDKLYKFFPEVDEWKGVEEFANHYQPRFNLTLPHIGFLKICEGCINRCSYCAIPLIKGSLVSRPEEEIIKEARIMDRRGVKEVNIIGQDITSWGRDLTPKRDLSYLLKLLLRYTKNIRWFRLLYTHPRHFTSSLLDIVAHEERICKYIDLPLQHINDRILKMMNRRITRKEIISLIKKIRKKIKGVVLRTSFIVGFPGETEEEFKELVSFVEDMKFERVGVFVYSREEHTAAYNFKPQVHYQRRLARYRKIMLRQQKISYNFNLSFIGKRIKVLVDTFDNGVYIGRPYFSTYETDGVVFIEREDMKVGRFYNVNVYGALTYDLLAR